MLSEETPYVGLDRSLEERHIETADQTILTRKLPIIHLSRYQAKIVSETIGSFLFLMTISLAEVNCGITAIDGKTRTRNLAPIAEGFVLSVIIFAFGYISGGHFNPAVTFASIMIRGMPFEEGLGYWLAQVVGGFLGAGFGIIVNGTTRHLPAPQVYRNTPEYIFAAFIAEAIFTCFIVTVVLHVVYSQQRRNDFYGLAIGMCLLASQYAVGGVSGGAFNPAVATALQLTKFIAAGYVTPLMHLWLYWAAPMSGAVLAAFLFKMTHPPPPSSESALTESSSWPSHQQQQQQNTELQLEQTVSEEQLQHRRLKTIHTSKNAVNARSVNNSNVNSARVH